MNNKAGTQVPVLIVGGGISGLSAALFLLEQGITPLVAEKKMPEHGMNEASESLLPVVAKKDATVQSCREYGAVINPVEVNASVADDPKTEKEQPGFPNYRGAADDVINLFRELLKGAILKHRLAMSMP